MFKAKARTVIVTEMESGEEIRSSGIILKDDDMSVDGIKSRWAKVFSVGEGVTDIVVGEYILVLHGRWSRVVTHNNVEMQMVDYPDGVLLASDVLPVPA